MKTVKSRTVYALLLTFEESGEIHQHLNLYSLKGNASAMRRAFVPAAEKQANARMIADTLEKLQVVPVLDDDNLFLAAHAVAVTWEGESGVEQSIELFESAEDAEVVRARHERAFANGARGRLVALTCEKMRITAPISEGDAAFRFYSDTVSKLRRD